MILAKAASDAHGKMFLAEKQTAGNIYIFWPCSFLGRGRRGRSWISENAENLYFSFVWKTLESGPTALAHMVKLNFAISVATARACRDAGQRIDISYYH